jgi:molybdopterin converting factor subunit 1
MSIRVLFFASLADVTGLRETEMDAAAFPDVGSIYNYFEAAYPQLGFYRATLMYALNSEFANPGSPVKDGDEVAFLPPVSGG